MANSAPATGNAHIARPDIRIRSPSTSFTTNKKGPPSVAHQVGQTENLMRAILRRAGKQIRLHMYGFCLNFVNHDLFDHCSYTIPAMSKTIRTAA
jgi:hypothetical protein